MTINCIRELKNEFEHVKFNLDNSAEYNMYAREMEKAIKRAGFDLKKIYQLKDGRFKISTPFQCCKREKMKLLEELFDYYYPNGLSKTLKELFESFIKKYTERVKENERRSELTINDYVYNYRRFIEAPGIADMPITDIKASFLKRHYEKMIGKHHLTKHGLGGMKTLFNAIFDEAVDNDIIMVNIARALNTSKLDVFDEKEVNPYTDEERIKILNILDFGNVKDCFVGLLFCLNVRVGELRALYWEDVNFNDRDIYIHAQMRRKHISGTKKEKGHNEYYRVEFIKGKKEDGKRYEYMSDLAYTILKAQQKRHPFGYVFLNPETNNPFTTNDINKHLAKLCKKAGVEYRSSHKIRYRAITAMYEHGIDEELIRKCSGHTDAKMTQHYNRSSKKTVLNREFGEEIFG